MQAYKTQNRAISGKKICFTLRKGEQIDEDMEIRGLKNELKRNNLNGLVLFTQFPMQTVSAIRFREEREEEKYFNQNSVTEYL